MNINVNIERLILEGIELSPHQRPVLGAVVEAELARLLAEGGLAAGWQAGGAMPHLSGGVIQLNHQAEPIALGQQIAQAIYGGLNR